MRSLLFVLMLCTCGPAQMIAQCTASSEIENLALEAYLANNLTKWDAAVKKVQALPAGVENSILTAKILFGAAGAALGKGPWISFSTTTKTTRKPTDFTAAISECSLP